MKNKTKALIYQTPAILVLVAAFIGSFVVKVNGSYPIRWASVVLMGIIVVLFFIGKYYDNKSDFGF